MDAAKTCDELRRRLAATEQKFDDAQEELVVAGSRLEEARVVSEHRDAELQAELSESRCCTEALEQRLAKKIASMKRSGGGRNVPTSAITSTSMAALQAATTASLGCASLEAVAQVSPDTLDPCLKVSAVGHGDMQASLPYSSATGGAC